MTASIHGFKWDRAGYAELMDSAPVQALVKEKASEVCSVCNASFDQEAHEGEGYVMGRFQGRLTHGYYVRTNTPHARNSELRHNRLLDALG